MFAQRRLDLDFVQYGDPSGKKAIYFHGVPGGPEEAAVFDADAKAHNINLLCPARFSVESRLQGPAYYQSLAQSIEQEVGRGDIDIIGFSLGTHVAIEVSRLLKTNVRSLHLVSSAAPVSDGAFLPSMAGGSVFQTAMDSPRTFRAMTGFQRLLALCFPSLLRKMLFASAVGEDKKLSTSTEFIAYIEPLLSRCFRVASAGYLRDIMAYVKPWKPVTKAPTYLWHGSEDNWSPIAMAYHLQKELNECEAVHEFAGLSHYSCLQRSTAGICAQLAEV